LHGIAPLAKKWDGLEDCRLSIFSFEIFDGMDQLAELQDVVHGIVLNHEQALSHSGNGKKAAIGCKNCRMVYSTLGTLAGWKA
jgi:hypothetical protein